MQLVRKINPKLSLLFLLLSASLLISAQENSPFSRYGLGDIYNGQNVVNRGMGGLSIPFVNDYSVNFYNPASYSNRRAVTFDVGVGIDSRNLKSATPTSKFNSVNFTPSYVMVSLPIDSARHIGFTFGLRPVSKINYSIQQAAKFGATDSIITLYEGNGGLNELFAGFGKRWGGLSLGFNGGATFGKKQTDTKVFLYNSLLDSINFPYRSSNSGTTTSYGSAFINAGFQYELHLGKTSLLRLGGTANFKKHLHATQDVVREIFQYDANGNAVRIDSAYVLSGISGRIVIPATYTGGILLQTFVKDRLGNKFDKGSIGMEYETTKWSQYTYFGQSDKLVNSWQVRVGGDLTPNPLSGKNYWNQVNYRAGFFVGRDPSNADGKMLPLYGVTLGAGLPVRKWRSYDNQFSIINTAFEIGKRGNKNNNVTENFFRLSVGLSLSDIWFVKRRYD